MTHAAPQVSGAWLTPLKVSAHQPGRCLLVPISSPSDSSTLESELSVLGEFLRLLGAAWRARRPGKTSGASARKRAAPSGGMEPDRAKLPLLGQAEWIGSPAEGGVAIIQAPDCSSLAEFMRKHTALAAAQALPLLSSFAGSIAALFNMLNLPDVECEKLRHVLMRLQTPEGLALRNDRAELILRPHIPPAPPVFRPPAAADFISPEIYRGQSHGAQALVFTFARVASSLLGIQVKQPVAPEEQWNALAAWVAGKRNPADEFLAHPRAAELPAELREFLANCLCGRAGGAGVPARRGGVTSIEKLSQALDAMKALPWASAGTPCAACGFVRLSDGADANTMCEYCGMSAPRSGTGLKEREADADRIATSERIASGPLVAEVAVTGMTLISAGTFLSGEDKVPRSLRAYAIDTTPVTEGEYKRFLTDAGKTARASGPGSREPEFDSHPVTRVTWYEATEFAEFYGKRLPTVFEWEKAARGSDGRKFPFGNEYKSGHGLLRIASESSSANRRQAETVAAAGGTTAVGSFPAGASPYGVMDMAGNVLEWTSSARRAGERLFRAVKGSCFIDGSSELARCTSVQYLPPESAEPHVGFRCVKDVD